ncbi:MAG: PIG-L family deacetylase [Streptomycetaceae bacterium]|jgi:LmbE family N-acetylglucosaminyl deacetylase|nr:MAG: PIG-L family deacetylase [Streptomycetaceae bacterium]
MGVGMNSEFVEIASMMPTPDIFSCKRVLAIQAHYDDIDIAIGGLITKLVKNGAEILYVTVTDDLAGVIDLTLSKEIAASRLKNEAEKAAQILGVLGIYNLNYPDAGDWSVYQARRDLITIVRQFQPDCVLTLDPWLNTEAHADHYKSGFAAVEATILADVLGVEGTDLHIPKEFLANHKQEIQAVGLFNSSQANTFVDIDQVLETKLAAVSQYISQFTVDSMAAMLGALPKRSKYFAGIGHSVNKLSREVTYSECLKVLSPGALHAAR